MANLEGSNSGNNEDDLKSFREQWKRELQSDPSQQSSSGESKPEYVEDDIHKEARDLFQKGVQLEESGKLYDAIRYYKRAVALVPDIEYQTYLYNKEVKKAEPAVKKVDNFGDENGNNLAGSAAKGRNDSDGEEDNQGNQDDMVNLVSKFARLQTSNCTTIQQEFPSQETHIGALPQEVLNYILKWVVSSELDVSSLEACAQVSRGFYLAARDEEIWRLICLRTWGAGVAQNNPFSKWREMFITRPRVKFDGCYTSRMSYIREGERSFQDHESHKAWYIVAYFRFLRLFPGGRALMVTTADDPGLATKLMNNRNFCSIQGAMYGDYRIVDNILVCVLHDNSSRAPDNKRSQVNRNVRRKKKEKTMDYYDVPDQDFHIEFYIKNGCLYWKNYNIISKYKSGREKVEQVNVADVNKFPKLNFFKVGSYQFESGAPLKMPREVRGH